MSVINVCERVHLEGKGTEKEWNSFSKQFQCWDQFKSRGGGGTNMETPT